MNVPKRMDLPVLGTEIDDIADLDVKYLANEEKFRLNADRIRQAREARGEGSMYSLLQPFSRPNVNELLGRRIDMLYSCTLPGDGGNLLRWCQGEVIEIYTGKQKPTVCVLWDPMPDVEGSEELSDYLGIKIERKPDGTLEWTQPTLTQSILKDLKLDGEEIKGRQNKPNVRTVPVNCAQLKFPPLRIASCRAYPQRV